MAAVFLRAVRQLVSERLLSTSATLCRRATPLSPLPNEQFEGKEVKYMKKYLSFTRYNRVAESESKKPFWWKTCRQYIQLGDDGVSKKMDIGLPYLPTSTVQLRKARKQIMRKNRSDAEFERASRHRILKIPLDDVRAEWEHSCGPRHIKRVAEHYGVFNDLFGDATFVPRVLLNVHYSTEDDMVTPVYYGNVVTASKVAVAPNVTYESLEGTFWTLLLTNPDGHLRDPDSEYVHWLIGNIPGNQVLAGDEICHYFPPFPSKGTGYHRYVFILFKQEEHIDYTEEMLSNPCHSLKRRTFKTLDFYRKYENKITPGGLAFFHCRWEDDVTEVFHQLLKMKEPNFEHQFSPDYHPPQMKFPHAQPLRYLDRYWNSDEPTFGIY